jgi:hypothetical protein
MHCYKFPSMMCGGINSSNLPRQTCFDCITALKKKHVRDLTDMDIDLIVEMETATGVRREDALLFAVNIRILRAKAQEKKPLKLRTRFQLLKEKL